MSRRTVAGVLVCATVVLLTAVAHVFHAAFFGVFGVTPGEVGLGLHEQTLHLAVPTAMAVLVVGATVLLALLLQKRLARQARFKGRRGRAHLAGGVLASLAVFLIIVAALEVARIAGVEPDFWGFVRANPGMLVAVVAAVVAVLAAVAFTAAEGWRPAALAVSAGVALVLASGAALYTADRWGSDLGRRVALGAPLDPAFNPFGLRVERRCVDGRLEEDDERLLHGVHLLLGRVAERAFVVDDSGTLIRVAGQSLKVALPVNDACRGDTPPVVDDATAERLAKEFRPILRFDRREPWRPLEIEAFLAESFPTGQPAHRVCPQRGDCPSAHEVPVLRQERGARLDLHDSKASPLEQCRVGVLRDCDEGARSAIYYRVTANTRGRLLIDYWWFLRFNHFPYFDDRGAICGGRPAPGSNHEGDWEGVTVIVDAEAPDEIETVAYSAHGHSFRYLQVVPIREETRPVVYVACGSHAAYPRPCGENCRQTQHACDVPPCPQPTSGRAEAPYDGFAEWGRNDDAKCETPPDQPCLRPLPMFGEPQSPLDEGLSAAVVPFTTWPGFWGEKRGPQSPGAQRRYQAPSMTIPSERTDFGAREGEGKLPQRGSF